MFSTVVRSAQLTARITTTYGRSLARETIRNRRFMCEKVAQPKDNMARVTDFDKMLLMKAKMYKTAEEIPELVSQEKMKKARDYMRIRMNIWMIVATVGACIVMVITGKRMRDSGDSLSKRGLEWERSMREQGRQEEADRKEAKAAGNA